MLFTARFNLHAVCFATVLLIVATWSTIARCDDASDIDLAAQNGDIKAVAALLRANPKLVSSKSGFGETPLHMAAGNGHKDIVILLLANKADINAKSEDDGATPLHWAVEDGNKEMVVFLLSKGADINAKANDGITPLQEAEIKNHKQIADLLRQRGGHE